MLAAMQCSWLRTKTSAAATCKIRETMKRNQKDLPRNSDVCKGQASGSIHTRQSGQKKQRSATNKLLLKALMVAAQTSALSRNRTVFSKFRATVGIGTQTTIPM